MMKTVRIGVVGLGGIGTQLIYPLCRYLEYRQDWAVDLTLADGDSYEPSNRERQQFTELGNKAEVTASALKAQFSNLSPRAIPEYITLENIYKVLPEGVILFACVDKHRVRRLLSKESETLRDVVLISAGNSLTQGNVQIMIRKEDQEYAPPLTKFHPEIEHPEDENPGETPGLACEEVRVHTPQSIFTNHLTASGMMVMFAKYLQWEEQGMKGSFPWRELYLDITQGAMKPALQNPQQGKIYEPTSNVGAKSSH